MSDLPSTSRPDNASLPYHRDPGLQPERSSLSWARTCFSLFVVVLVQLRLGHLALIPTIVALSTIGWVFLTATERYQRQSHGVDQEHYEPNTVQVVGLASVVLVVAVSMLVSFR